MTALTVFVISASYSQTIDLFPSGGGGYLVATKLLGPYPGLVSGSALVIDYVLTISISIASGADAIFSFLPTNWLWLKFWLCLVVVVLMVGMNLRGSEGIGAFLAPDLPRLRGDACLADRLCASWSGVPNCRRSPATQSTRSIPVSAR